MGGFVQLAHDERLNHDRRQAVRIPYSFFITQKANYSP